ncbi:hypothetical protein MBLNU13_g05499t1 [Cladosporium sp. NU13]
MLSEPRLPEADLTLTPTAPVIVPINSQQPDVNGRSQSTGDATTIEINSVVDTPMLDSTRPLQLLPFLPTLDSGQEPQEERQQNEVGTHSDMAMNPSHISAIVEDYTSPASLADLSRRHESGHRLTWGTGEYGFLTRSNVQENPVAETTQMAAHTATTELSHREALLVQHFAQKLAPWIDCCDPVCHFAQEVPRRAVHNPMVLYAVLALSSRHQSLLTKGDANEGSYYHGKCLELVIRELSKPESYYDDNLFATMVCMRVYEELDYTSKADDFLHLKGVGRLLRAIPTFAHSGGLAEAASWQALRQDVYVAIRDKVQPSFDLDNYGLSRVFDFRDDAACANVVILLFGRILRLLYSPSGSMLYDAWREIEDHVKLWDAQRSRVFQPLFVKEAIPGENQPFPIIRLINSAQVVALQYYNACLVLIRQHKPPDRTLHGFEAVKERRSNERGLIAALGKVIGLADSNTWVENANFTAHHMLMNSGYHISNKEQRDYSIAFLRRVQENMGFQTQSTIALLESQWMDLD